MHPTRSTQTFLSKFPVAKSTGPPSSCLIISCQRLSRDTTVGLSVRVLRCQVNGNACILFDIVVKKCLKGNHRTVGTWK